MAKREIHYKPDMVCPYCGNEEFFIAEKITENIGYKIASIFAEYYGD